MGKEEFAMALFGKSPEILKAAVEEALIGRLREIDGGYLTSTGNLNAKAQREQAAFISGALAGMQALLGNRGDKNMNPAISGMALGWILAINRGDPVRKFW